MSRTIRQRLLIVLGMVALSLAVTASYVHITFGDSDEFARRAAVAFEDPAVRSELTDSIVDLLIRETPELVAIRPLLHSVVDGLLATDAAGALLEGTVRDVHRTLFTDDQDTILLQVSDLILVAKTQISVLSPELGAKIPDDLTDRIIDVRAAASTIDSAQFVAGLETWVYVLLSIAIAAFVAVLWRSRDASAGLVAVGSALVGASVLSLVVFTVGRWLLIDGDDEVARAVWDAFVDPVDSWALLLASIGAIVASVAWFGVGETELGRRRSQLAHLLRRRTDRRGRAIWGAAMLLTGLFVVTHATQVVRLSVTIVGVFVLALGGRELAATAVPSLVEGAGERRDREQDGDRSAVPSGHHPTRRSTGRWVATSGVLAVGGLAIVAVAQGDAGTPIVETGCNGRDDLCDRRFDDVVIAATHNSHAAAADGFLNGYQLYGIRQQLDDGIRGLLIDVYFGFEDDSGLVVTDRVPLTADERAALVADVGESAVAAAEATARSFERQGVEADLYLCHALCEIGARRFVDVLDEIAAFVDEHPREVLVIIVQDEGPLPDDVAAAFEEAGLLDDLYAHEPGEPFPTLGEMIDSGRRIVVAAEKRSGGGYDWYHAAFDLVQDTSYLYASIDDFECSLNRGSPDSPLLLVNHWVNPVSPIGAESANDDAVLLDRIEECEATRGRLPNLIAVDFFDRGDLIEVVDQLN